jgi:hypothetical protein
MTRARTTLNPRPSNRPCRSLLPKPISGRSPTNRVQPGAWGASCCCCRARCRRGRAGGLFSTGLRLGAPRCLSSSPPRAPTGLPLVARGAGLLPLLLLLLLLLTRRLLLLYSRLLLRLLLLLRWRLPQAPPGLADLLPLLLLRGWERCRSLSAGLLLLLLPPCRRSPRCCCCCCCGRWGVGLLLLLLLAPLRGLMGL